MFGKFFKHLDKGESAVKILMEKHSESLDQNDKAHKRFISACDAPKQEQPKLRVVR